MKFTFLPSQIDKMYVALLGCVWFTYVTAAFIYCEMYVWVFPGDYSGPYGPLIWFIARGAYWPYCLPLAFMAFHKIQKNSGFLPALAASWGVVLITATIHANIFTNMMGLTETLAGSFYHMVPRATGVYALFLIISWAHAKRMATGTKGNDEPVVIVNKGRTVVRLPVSKIDWLQSARNYVDVHSGGSTYILRNTLSKMEDILPEGQFLRVHRSYIVNQKAIKGVGRNSDGNAIVHLKTGDDLPCGRAHKESVAAYLKAS